MMRWHLVAPDGLVVRSVDADSLGVVEQLEEP